MLGAGDVDSAGVNNGEDKQRQDWLPADHGTTEQALQGRVARGLTWMLIDSWGAQLLSLIFFVMLARLLSEADFGLVALAIVFIHLAWLLVDQGLGDALVQRASLTRRQIDTCFWASVGGAVVLTLLSLVLAGPLSRMLGQPGLEPVIQVLSATFIFTAVTHVQMAIVRREMRFRDLAVRRLTATLGAGIVGIMLAFAGAGVWSLVVQQIVGVAVSATVLWTVSPWRPGWQFSMADYRELLPFGRHLLGSELLHYASRNVDNLLIGGFMGTVALGLYSVAYKLLDTGTQLMINATHKLAFPVFSRLQMQRERLTRAYVRVTKILALVTLPGYVGLALVATEAVIVIFGERWAPAAQPAALLFLAGPVLAVQLLSGSLLNAVGHPEVTFRIRLITTLVNILGFLVAVIVFRDITAVAAAYTIRAYALLPLILHWLKRYAAVPWSAHLSELRTPFVATAVMAGAVIAAKLALTGAVGLPVLLAVEVLVGISVYAGTVLLIDRALVAEVRAFLASAVPGGGRVAQALSGTDVDAVADGPTAADA